MVQCISDTLARQHSMLPPCCLLAATPARGKLGAEWRDLKIGLTACLTESCKGSLCVWRRVIETMSWRLPHRYASVQLPG